MRKHSGCFPGKLDMEIGSNIDISLLRLPLTPFTGFQEAKSAFDKGSTEVRHLLLYECGLIYECNVCRNMFRSLANFISHKRIFCSTSSKEYISTHNSTDGTDGIQRSKHQRQKMNKAEHNICNEQINTITRDVEETNNDIIESTNQNQKASRVAERRNAENSKPTEQSNNQSLEYVFQCPSCSLTFQKSSTVLRHLANAHNIPIRRICMMRDSLLKCAAKSTEEIVENETPSNVKQNGELSSLQMNDCSSSSIEEKKDAESDTTESLRCFFCQKSFEHRDALIEHIENCSIKTEVLEQSEEANPAIINCENIKEETESNNISKDATDNSVTDADDDIEFKQNQLQSFESETNPQEDEDLKRTFVDLELQNFGFGLQTVTLDKLYVSASESTNASLLAENDTEEADENEIKADETLAASSTSTTDDIATTLLSIKKRRMRPSNAQFCRCKICGKHFNALSNLRRHISMFHYRARKFGCALCDYCAFRRYDIVNHLNFVHKLDTDSDTAAKDLVRVNDVQYTKDDMNEDIVLCTNEERIAAENSLNSMDTEVKSIEQNETSKLAKRQRRRLNKILNLEGDTKNSSDQLSNDNEIAFKLTRQKLKRSKSQATESPLCTKGSQKRPKRNRTKPVNKDFVYDLSDLVKKGQTSEDTVNQTTECETYQLRGSKRRNTIIAQFDQTPAVPAFDIIKVKHCNAIKGAARRCSLMIVHQGRAALSTPPEIPAERPQMRPRLTSTQRSDSQAGPIIETSELELERFKSLPLCDDLYLEKIAKESVGSFKIKPCLEQLQQHSSALDSLLQKVDSSKQLINGYARNVSNQIGGVQSIDLKESLFDSTLLESGCNNNIPTYLTPEQAIPKTLSTPLRPQKRLPSLDRLTETINSLENFYNVQLNN